MSPRAQLVALLWVAFCPRPAAGQAMLEQPVGLVVAAGDGKVVRARDELPLAAKDGEILYAGDALRSGSTPMTFLFCPQRSSQNLEPNGRATLENRALRVSVGRLTGKKMLEVCLLPRLERAPPASQQHYGGSLTRALGAETAEPSDLEAVPEPRRSELRAKLAPVEQAIAKDSSDSAAHVARAALYEEYGLNGLALEEYESLAALLPDAAWVRSRIFVHEKEQGRIVPAVTSLREGKVYALLVGISRYQRLRPEQWLRYPHRDAQLFDEHLRSPRGGSLPDSNIVLLTDERATTAAVRNAFETFVKARAGKKDTVVIFIAAHGIVESTGRRGAYIVTHDSDPEDLATTALPMADLQNLIEEDLSRVGHVLVFVDVCRAGTIGSLRGTNSVNRAVEQLGEADGDIFLFLASGPKELSYEGPQYGGGHGAFSYFLLDAMNGAADVNQDGVVSVGEIIEYVRDRVTQATNNRQHPRDAGSMARVVVVTETRRPGISLAGFAGPPATPAVPAAAETRGNAAPEPRGGRAMDNPAPGRELDEAIASGRLLPDLPQSAFVALRSLQRQLTPEQYLLAQNKLRVALENVGQQVVLRYLAGDQTAQTHDDFQNGGAYFEAALLLTPESLFLKARAAFCNGRAMLFDKSYAWAIDFLERAARFDPGGAYSHNALGIAYLEQADYINAALAFRDAIRRAPNWAYPRHNLALLYTQTGEYPNAIRAYQQAMEIAPQYSYLPYNLGLVYQKLNRRKEAEAAYRKAIALAPQSAEPYNALGSLYAAYRRAREAERLYRQALEKNPKLLPARHNLAVLLASLPGRTTEAHDLWNQNLAQAPEYLPSRLSLARSLARQGYDAEALREYTQILRQKPDYVAARLALAEIHVRRKSPEDALAELKAALSVQPENAALHEWIGDIDAGLGRRAEAAESYRSALSYAPDSSARKRIQSKIKTGAAPK
jgi:tetratricopeptide (TPR) repeat protein